MSDLPQLPYALLYGERALRSVANNTRSDGREFFAEAAGIGVRTHVQTYPLLELQRALVDLKHGVAGAAVVMVQRGR